MSIICDEIKDVKNHCESQIPGSKIIACVPSMIRVDIKYDVILADSFNFISIDIFIFSGYKIHVNHNSFCYRNVDFYVFDCVFSSFTYTVKL